MTDDQVEKLIWKEIRQREITLQDMIGGESVDPDPEDTNRPQSHRMRRNRFVEIFGEHRMKELLCVGQYCEHDDMPVLKICFQDLFRFWWNRCIVKELFADEVLQDIFDYFADCMKPKDKSDQMEVTLDFNQLTLFPESTVKAA